MNNQNISMLGRDAHINSSECELCYNLLYQLYDSMSAISFMRECISEPMNPSPLFIIRNTFLFTLRMFLFLTIINFENTKIFLYCISQTKTLQPYLLLFIIALYIYFQFCILTHTLCLTTTWWG
jgi:hypothetical protein